MKRFLHLLSLLAALTLAGCATTAPRSQVVARLTPEQLAALQPVPNPALPLADVIALSKAGTVPKEIIKRLHDTHTIHVLTAQQIADLARQGVDQSVIDYMADVQEKARQSRLLTELADRDAEQARRLEHERQMRWAAEQGLYGGFSYGYPGYSRYGWNTGYYSRFPYPYYPYRH